MSKFPTRKEKAGPDLRMLATLMYIIQQEHQEDYVVLLTVKTLQYKAKASGKGALMAILDIQERDLETLCFKGW